MTLWEKRNLGVVTVPCKGFQGLAGVGIFDLQEKAEYRNGLVWIWQDYIGFYDYDIPSTSL